MLFAEPIFRIFLLLWCQSHTSLITNKSPELNRKKIKIKNIKKSKSLLLGWWKDLMKKNSMLNFICIKLDRIRRDTMIGKQENGGKGLA